MPIAIIEQIVRILFRSRVPARDHNPIISRFHAIEHPVFRTAGRGGFARELRRGAVLANDVRSLFAIVALRTQTTLFTGKEAFSPRCGQERPNLTETCPKSPYSAQLATPESGAPQISYHTRQIASLLSAPYDNERLPSETAAQIGANRLFALNPKGVYATMGMASPNFILPNGGT